jgi:deoxyribonuclease-4
MFGSHLSVAGGLINALNDATALKLDTVQVFTKNQRQWAVPPLDPAAARDWLAELARLGWQRRTVAHDSYLINLASPDDSPGGLWEKSIASMREELDRAAALSIPFLVSHPGAHMIKEGSLDSDARIEAGLVRIARAYKKLLRDTRGYAVTICLENTAGGGTTLGVRFEHLARLRELILSEAGPDADLPKDAATDTHPHTKGARIGFCLDTCHALAAGYDISATDPAAGKKRTQPQSRALAAAMLDHFDATCGLANLRVLHLNDSLGKHNSRIDRHAHIGQGHVAPGAFGAIISDPRLEHAPKILETPKEDDPKGIPMDTINLRTLRKLAASASKDPSPKAETKQAAARRK